jgi:hypothetical protein
MQKIISAAAVLAVSGSALASIDGKDFDLDYGASIWAQNIGTQFGNNNDASVEFANGSEINALYARIQGGKLFLGVAGNVETNFNKLNIALDIKAGGQNTLSGLPNLGNLDGLTFDNGFDADVVLSYTGGNDPVDTFIDGATTERHAAWLPRCGHRRQHHRLPRRRRDQHRDRQLQRRRRRQPRRPFDSDPGSVTTGVEWSIDIAALGWTYGDEIRIAGWINGQQRLPEQPGHRRPARRHRQPRRRRSGNFPVTRRDRLQQLRRRPVRQLHPGPGHRCARRPRRPRRRSPSSVTHRLGQPEHEAGPRLRTGPSFFSRARERNQTPRANATAKRSRSSVHTRSTSNPIARISSPNDSISNLCELSV